MTLNDGEKERKNCILKTLKNWLNQSLPHYFTLSLSLSLSWYPQYNKWCPFSSPLYIPKFIYLFHFTLNLTSSLLYSLIPSPPTTMFIHIHTHKHTQSLFLLSFCFIVAAFVFHSNFYHRDLIIIVIIIRSTNQPSVDDDDEEIKNKNNQCWSKWWWCWWHLYTSKYN